MSDLVDKLKKQQAEQAAKRQVNSPDTGKAASSQGKVGSATAVDNRIDDDAIMEAKRSKPGGQAGKSTIAEAIKKATSDPAPVIDPTQDLTSHPTEYTVVSGDNLSAIAQKHYGDANRWREIYDANKETIGANPSAIRVGMVLKIPR